MIEVVHVAPGLDVGGLEKLLVEFARHADRGRFHLRFVSLTTCGKLAQEIRALGWQVSALNDPGGLRPRLTLELARLFSGWQADVIHTHDERPLLYAAPAGQWAGAKVIHTRHGQKARNSRRQVLLFRWAAAFADRLVGVSRDSACLTLREGVSQRKVCTIRNGIDLDRFAFSGPDPQGPAVTVARLSQEKGIDTLLRAMALVVRKFPGFRLDIAGTGPAEKDLRDLQNELGLASQVRFLGEIKDIPALLGRARFFVLASNEEGIPLTVLEAMACGLPVAATRVGGTPEAVQDGLTGWLVPSREPEALAQAMIEVLADREEGRRRGREGRLRVEENFDVRRMIAEYEALYLKLFRPPRTSRLALAGSGERET